MLTRKIYKGIVIIALLLLSICKTYAQTIDGTTSVNAEETYYYSVSGSLPSGAVWHAYYGDIISSSSNGASVKWRCGMSTGTVYVTTSANQTITYKDVTINQNPTFNPGSITAALQYVNYNDGTTITGSNATGGTCNGGDYYYQWETSSDGQNFSVISGATGLNYSMGGLTASVTYYRRGAKRGASSSYQYSGVVAVHAYPQLVAGAIGSSQNINNNAVPNALTSIVATGGNSNYSYQWQVSSNPNPPYFNDISGANTLSYQPGNLTSTTYYMLKVSSNGAIAYSNMVTVNVYPFLAIGNITPSAITIAYNGSPGPLTAGTPSGGNGTYAFQWWSSTDNSTYTSISSAGQNSSYTPTGLQQTMYYKVELKSNGVSVFSNIATVTVLVASGVAAPTDITGDANNNMNWVKATAYDATGNTISAGKQFFDYSGQLVQSQNKVFYRLNNSTVYTHVFASQPMRDELGRTAASTLSAPIDGAEFNYKPYFVQASDGSPYSYKNFENGPVSLQATRTLDQPNTSGTYQASQAITLDNGFETAANADFIAEIVTANGGNIDKTNSPEQVGNQNVKGTLGWYYSSNNTWEPYTPTTGYPYSRQSFYSDGTGNVKKTAGTGEVFKMGSGHEGSSSVTPVINELNHYLQVRNQFFTATELGAAPTSLQYEAVQTVSKDANGRLGLSIQDRSGKTLMVGRPGSDLAVSNTATIKGGNVFYFRTFASGSVNISSAGNQLYNMEVTEDQSLNIGTGGTIEAGYYKLVNTGTADITVMYSNSYSDLSYNFYNQLGQVIATIAPEGVKKLYGSGLNNYVTKSEIPFIALYEYDVQGRLIKSTSKDGGIRELVYRTDGKMRFSQNAEQKINGRYSYTNYDKLGRPIETGEYWPDPSGIQFNSDLSVASSMRSILNNTTSTGGLTIGDKKDVIITVYDIADNTHNKVNYEQTAVFLGGTISMTRKYSSIVNNVPDNNNMVSATWYNYDEDGKVVWMIEFIKGLGYKTTDYSYDALGRLVKKVFQKEVPATAETFVHYYEYDAATQNLWKVYTAKTELPTDRKLQATYIYYLHGPLKRIELANDMQGIDYTYTLQGALKAINNSDKTKDPGVDGSNVFNADAFGMVLDYYPGDYKNNRTSGIQPITGVNSTAIGADSYAGNIKAMTWFSRKPASEVASNPAIEDPTSYIYEYDNKYQFTESTWGTGINFCTPTTGTNFCNTPATFTATGFNKEKIKLPNNAPAYDANGNILYLQRTKPTGALDNRFTYNYLNTTTNTGSTTDYNTNKLQSVVDDAGGTPVSYASYMYDLLGQLTVEKDGNGVIRKTIKYDVTGKVISVERNAGEPIVEYVYNERGKRVIKKSYNMSHQLSQVTYYVGDVIYTQAVTGGTTYGNIVAQEYEVKGGSGRLGVYYRQSDIYAYELNDHLGNVRAVVAKSGTTMEVRVYADYYPYGMRIRGADGYRYGYQGQYAEKDNETDWNAFELRMYDSKIARWLSVDPKRQFNSPYIGMGNDPVNGVDKDGGFWEELKNYSLGRGWMSNNAYKFVQSLKDQKYDVKTEWVGSRLKGHLNVLWNSNETGWVRLTDDTWSFMIDNPTGHAKTFSAMQDYFVTTSTGQVYALYLDLELKVNAGLQFAIDLGKIVKIDVNVISYDLLKYSFVDRKLYHVFDNDDNMTNLKFSSEVGLGVIGFGGSLGGEYAPKQGFEISAVATNFGIDIEVTKNLMQKEAGAVMGIGLSAKEALIVGVESKLFLKNEQIPNNDKDAWLKR